MGIPYTKSSEERYINNYKECKSNKSFSDLRDELFCYN